MKQTDLSYDVHFNNDNNSNNKGFSTSIEQCKNYISQYNGTSVSYFGDYKGGTVSIVCNENGETVYSTPVKEVSISGGHMPTPE